MTDKIEKLHELGMVSKAWPFEEARKIVNRYKEQDYPEEVRFQTGYGPSGLPHIGTFGEVARTTMVQHAFRVLTKNEVPTRLICFSDDLDGLRKVPTNIPNQHKLAEFIDFPLTKVPNPFDTPYDSFAAHNNALLQSFLDQFGFEYNFYSSTEIFQSGQFDKALLRMLDVYDKVMDIILPTIGPDRQSTYAPFLPISERTGKVLQVPALKVEPENGLFIYRDPDTGEEVATKVTGGKVKCQWKADWALRWYALGIDYEMSGKDLIDSVKLSSKIVRALGGQPPESFSYELFLDEKGQKISKSKGNGLSIEEWLTYANTESLALFMYQKPKTAKKLHFDVIPKMVDEYYTWSEKFAQQSIEEKVNNPLWHLHSGDPEVKNLPISFSLLLNLVSAANATDREILWGFIQNYAPDISPQNNPDLDQLVTYAMRYYQDFVLPEKHFRQASEKEAAAMQALIAEFDQLNSSEHNAEAIQQKVYQIGKDFEFENLRDWFQALYQVLLGQNQGPRFGSFVALYGIEETKSLINKALDGDLL